MHSVADVEMNKYSFMFASKLLPSLSYTAHVAVYRSDYKPRTMGQKN